ncbi:serine/threonine-protein kinase [Pseudoalteromonas rubra]|uniref:serine/threonine-protein kinase n=1 Tax=Pseudoalteromonas rubra TaxID=43658 RepID=UPI000F7668B2|nr:serine/threonine-protein kinase [Pseudoalteromonas rubra]
MTFNDALSVFDYLLTHSPDDLTTGLERIHNISSTLKKEVSALIAAHKQNAEQTLFSSIIANRVNSLDSDKNLLSLAGEQIQHFKLISLLGSGGMGVVYLAERCDGQLEQQVAIKIIDPSVALLTSKELAFKEAQHLARLNHPNIAKIYDIGTTESDLIYLIIEYIEGESLQAFCTDRPTKEVLTLFTKVCDAVNYSHQNRIIHGDLKPENILVDKLGEPKLVDFGVAHTLSEQSDATYSAYINGLSRDYASPEQLAGETLTTQSDVYSLGKVLEQIIKSPGQEVQSMINHACAEKDERYANTMLFSQDIERYLNVQPISLNNSRVYRSKKFIRRNPITTLLGASFFISLVTFSTVLWQKNTQLLKEQATSEQVANFMVDVFESADPAAYDGHEVSAQDLLLSAKQRLLKDKDAIAYQPKVALYLAQSLSGVGEYSEALALTDLMTDNAYINRVLLLQAEIYITQSNIESAKSVLQKIELASLSPKNQVRYYTSTSKTQYYSDEFKKALINLAKAEQVAIQHQLYSPVIEIKNSRTAIYQEQGKHSEQLEEAKLTLSFAKQHFAKDSAEHLSALFTLQSAYSANEEFDQANALLEDIYAVQIEIYPKDHPTLALTLNEMGNNYSRLGEYQKAIPLHKQAITMIKERYGKKHIDYAYGHSYLGNAYGYQKQFDLAIAAYQEALESSTLLYGKKATLTLSAARNLGLSYSEKGEQNIAKEILTDALEKTLTLYPEVSYRTALVKAALGRALLELEQWEEAKFHLEHAAEGFRQSVGEDSIRYTRTLDKLAKANKHLDKASQL